MSQNWMKNLMALLGGSKEQNPSKPQDRAQLGIEILEDRQVPAVITVNSVADNLTADDGLVTLREAINAANNDSATDLGDQGNGADTIVFDSDVFATPQTIQLESGQLSLSSELTISGPGANLLTLDAQDNSRVFLVNGSGDAVISGLTITGGKANSGGGIVNNGTLLVENVVVTGNRVERPPSDSLGGGGIHNNAGSLTVRNSVVTGNTFSGNTIITGGGGINVRAGTALIEGSTISNNSVNGTSRYGAGVSVLGDGNVTISGSTISGNTGGRGAGVFTRGTLTILDSTISDNTTGGNGGGLHEQSTAKGDTIVVNTTFSGNRGSRGGAIFADSGATLRNVSIVDNEATTDGGGVYASGSNDIKLFNTLIAGNTLTDDSVDDVGGSGSGVSAVSSHNLIADGSISQNNISHGTNGNIIGDGAGNNLDPSNIVELFLLDNGGPTLTHVLVPGSPALDAGSNTEAVDQDGNSLTFDQRGDGFARIFDGDGNGTATVDIGAVEVDEVLRLPITFVVDTLEDESDGDFSTGDLSLREAIELSNAAVAVDTITFDASLFANGAETLTLTLGELAITQTVTITGVGADLLTIDANGNSRIFFISDSVLDAKISGLALTGGSANLGGGILNQGTLSLDAVSVYGNEATGFGGGIENKGTITITNSTLSNNTARRDGGGISNFLDGPRNRVSITLVNSTVSGNSAGDNGGGIFRSKRSTTTILNSTILNNTAGDSGGGIHSTGTNTTFDMSNTIVANNTSEGVANDLGGTLNVNGVNNLIGDADSSANLAHGTNGNIVGDEGSGTLDLSTVINTTLSDNGGTTLTHALIGGGIAVDAGSNGAASALTVDQLGNTRIVEGDGDTIATVDIGAVEQQVVVFPSVTHVVDILDDENDGDFSQGDLSLREAIELSNNRPSKDTILFADSLAGGTILLKGNDFISPGDDGDLDITNDVTIIGLGADQLTIDAQGNSQLFTIGSNVFDSTISGLTLTGGKGSTGGAILNLGTLVIEDVVLHGNQATLVGGAIENFADLTVIGSTFYNNTAGEDGGAIDNFQGGARSAELALTLINSTISGNSAGRDGGGVWRSNFGDLTITNSTITDNTAARFGGGINLGGNGGLTTLHNSIVAGNTVNGVAHDLSGPGGTATGNNNIIGSASFAGGIVDGVNGNIVGIEANTFLDPVLQDNGGTTPTHALLDSSIAIDSGNNALVVGGDNDQRGEGFYRFSNGTVDIGAFEAQQNVYVVDILTDENDGNFSAGDLSLREAIALANASGDADIITFADSLTANGDATVSLTLFEDTTVGPTALVVSTDITITGPTGHNGITIAATGTDDFRLFQVTGGDKLTLENLNLTGGVAQGSEDEAGQGGAIYNQGTVILRNSTLYGNQAIGGESVSVSANGQGGAIYNDNGTVLATNSTLSGNSAIGGDSNDASVASGSGLGGAIYNHNGTVTITNSTLASSTISAGTGVGSEGSTNGGAIFNAADGSTARVTLTNTILADSIGGTDFDFVENNSISITSGEGNLIESNNGFVNVFNLGVNPVVTSVDPNLGALTDNGGPTLTHALSQGSSAVDAGVELDPDDHDLETLAFDQRRFAGRGFNGAVDIGAFELGASKVQPNATFVVSTLVDEVDGDLSSGDLSLREAILLAEELDDASTISFAPSLMANGDATISLSLFEDGDDKGQLGASAFIIDTDVTIVGPGGDHGITLQRTGNQDFRLFQVMPTGSLRLENLNLKGGIAQGEAGGTENGSGGGGGAGLGGAIVNQGSTTLVGVTLTENKAIGGAGGPRGSSTGRGGAGGGTEGGTGGPGRTSAGTQRGGTGQNGGLGGGGGGGGAVIATGGGTLSATGGDGGDGGFGAGGGGGGKAFAFNGPESAGVGGKGGFGAGDGTDGSILNNALSGFGGAGAGLGGAIFNDSGDLTIVNSTISGNRAIGGSSQSQYGALLDGNPGDGFGGGIFNRNGTVTISSSTIAKNSVEGGTSNIGTGNANGGGIYNLGDIGKASILLNNTILADSTGSTSDFVDDTINNGSVVSEGVGNLIEAPNNFAGEVVSSADPDLGELSDNRGPTLTHALQDGSAAIDAGNNAAAASLATDQRGGIFSRIADGNQYGTSQVDIGAYERVDIDYGDAPSAGTGSGSTLPAYLTLGSEDGPAHIIVNGLKIGSILDADPDGQPTLTADGDDLDGTDDEDGISTPIVVIGKSTSIDIQVTNTTGTDATLYGWIDFNGDGTFDSASERASATVADGIVDGTVTLTFSATDLSDGATFARFRLSTSPAAASPTGLASDGEVEDHTVLIDVREPMLTTAESPTNADPIIVTVDFGKTVSGFALTDITVSNGTVSNLQDLGNGVYTVAVSPSSDGVVTVDIAAAAVTYDNSGEPNVAAEPLTIVSDRTAPAPVLSTTASDPTTLTTIPVSINFGEVVSGFELADITVDHGTASNLQTSDNKTFTFNVTPTTDGLVTIDTPAGVAQDEAGNSNAAADRLSIVSDTMAPAPVISTSESDPTSATVIPVSIDFGEPVNGFELSDITVGNGTATGLQTTDNQTFTFNITPTAVGLVTIDVAGAVAQDLAGIDNNPADQLSITKAQELTITNNNGALTIRGDASSNNIQIVETGNPGEYLVRSDLPTIINGQLTPSATFSGVTAIAVDPGDGNDTIDLQGSGAIGTTLQGTLSVSNTHGSLQLENTLGDFDVAGLLSVQNSGEGLNVQLDQNGNSFGHVSVIDGNGNAEVMLSNADITGNLGVALGEGDNSVTLTGTTVGGDVFGYSGDYTQVVVDSSSIDGFVSFINNGSNDLSLTVQNDSSIGSYLSAISGEGNDSIAVIQSSVGDNLAVALGTGDNTMSLTGSEFQGDITGWVGNLSSVVLDSSTTTGHVSFINNGSDDLNVSVQNGTSVGTFLSVISGDGNDTVVLDGSSVADNFGVRLGGGTNDLSVTNGSLVQGDLFAYNVLSLSNSGALSNANLSNSEVNGYVSFINGSDSPLELTIDQVAIDGYLSVISGGGEDRVQVTSTTVGSNVAYELGAGANEVIHSNIDFQGATSIRTGNGNDQLQLEGSDDAVSSLYRGDAFLSTGAGDDTVDLDIDSNDRAQFFANYSLDGGEGTDTVDEDQAIFLGSKTVVNVP